MAPPVIAVPRVITTTALHAPSAATPAVVTLSAVSGVYRVIRAVIWSYNATPTGGRITITDGGATKWDFDITASGPGMMPLEHVFSENSAVVVTLASGGGAVTGKLTVVHYQLKA